MRYLILSDIHSNWEALQAVLSAAEGQYDQIICCGDFVGYGPDPNRVLDWAREHVSMAVRGNHDRACANLEDLEWFNPVAQTATRWTHGELSPENICYVQELPKGPVEVENFAVVHGSPRDEDEYLINPGEAREAFSFITNRITFFGHTHLQGGFDWGNRRVLPIRTPENGMPLELQTDSAYLINPGSVGQPRDLDPEAAYVLYNTEDSFLFFHRIAYDVKQVQKKIRQAGLPGVLADRLAVGR